MLMNCLKDTLNPIGRRRIAGRMWASASRTFRALLVAFAMAPPLSATAEQFTIECTWMLPYFVTFDTDAKRVVHESFAGTALKGRISAASAREIRFDLLQVRTAPFQLMWNAETGQLTWIGSPSDRTRGTAVSDCRRSVLRPILSEYDKIAPYD